VQQREEITKIHASVGFHDELERNMEVEVN